MRRLFIIRKDLHLSAGKLAAMVGHCCEAYWTNFLKDMSVLNTVSIDTDDTYSFKINIDQKIWHEYVQGIFTKTICEARNLNHLLKVNDLIDQFNKDTSCIDESIIYDTFLKEGRDYGFINDKCLTELTPENEDGTTTIGIWFRPLPDKIAHYFSKKYKLYRD